MLNTTICGIFVYVQKPEREHLNLRVDPSLQLIMNGFKKAMGVRSVDDVYDAAVRAFISNNSELAAQVQVELAGEEASLRSAIEELNELHTQSTESSKDDEPS